MDQEDNHLSLLFNGFDKMAVDGDAIKTALQEIDSRLELNSKSLKKEWQELIGICNESLNVDQDLENSKDAIDLLTSSELQNHVCQPEPMVLNCFLNNVIQALEHNPGLEEAILHELIKFASEHGLILPCALPTCSTEPKLDQDDENSEATETRLLWDKIRGKISSGLWNSFNSLKLDERLCVLNHKKQRELIQSQIFLYPLDHVWDNYLQFRLQLVEKYITSSELISDVETAIVVQYKDAPSNAITLAKLSRALEMLITEDMKILQNNDLPNKEMSFKQIFGIYLEQYTMELRSVLQAYREEKKSIAERRGSSRSTSSMSIHGDDLIVYKLCFLATVSLEVTVVKILEQNGKGIIPNILKPTVSSNVHVGGGHQLPKLTHRSSKELPVLEAWTGMSFGVGQSDFPNPHHAPSPWAWRAEFKHVMSRISLAVSETIKLGCDFSLEEQTKIYASTNTLQIIDLKDELVGGQGDYPKCITKSCSVIMSRAEDVLPLASSEGGKLFQVVRSSFVDTLDYCLKTHCTSIMKIISDFPHKCCLQTLYILLSSSVFVRNRLAHYEVVLGTEPRRPFAVLHRQYSELVESLTNQINNYHKHVIATIILQDADSHNWEDQRPFYEDERCSFSVQMWNYYIQGVQHDLWKYCPPAKAQVILTNLVHHSLLIFTLRYSNATPSYNRVQQFRSDVTAVLLCTLSFLWPCCNSLADLFDLTRGETMISSVHNMCSCLLSTMTMVTCPLDVLCKCLTSKKKKKFRPGSRTDWLSWLYPEVLKTHDGSLGVLIDRQALNVVFKLMINQPASNWPLVLQALLLRDARLAVIIVKYGDLSAIGSHVARDNTNPHGEHNRWCKDGISSGPQATTSKAGLVFSLYHVLSKAANQSSAIVNFLMALVNREDSWKLFETKSSAKALTPKEFPIWLNCLFDTWEPYITRMVTPSLRHFAERDRKRSKYFNFTAMSSLPCGCPCKPSPTKPDSKRGDTEIIYSALRELLTQLANNLDTIPAVIFQFIGVLQESLQRKSIDSSTAGMKILGWLLCRWLLDPDCVAKGYDTRPLAAVLNIVEVFAEVTWHVLINSGNTTGLADNPKFPMNFEAHLRSNREWLADKLQLISQHIANHDGDDFQAESIHDELSDIKATYTVKELLNTNQGACALAHIYQFLIDNKDWLMNLVLIPGHILPPKPTTNQPSSHALGTFNPMHKFTLIGEFAFDQAKIASFPFDWESLLQSDLGLVPDAMRRLVCNRFEMRDGAYLKDTEKELVAKLQAHYNIETVECSV